jgi:ATP adenylyltransferase
VSESFPKASLESLWAPWRVEYYHRPPEESGDFLTAAAQATDDAAHLVVTRRKAAFLIMNKYPYSAGHLMAVPYRKVADMADLLEGEILELWALCIHAQNLLRLCVKAQGFNVGWNLGKAAGAGVDDHLHLHIVPRWAGDANFMTVTGGARIIPEGLQPLYERLVAAQKTL